TPSAAASLPPRARASATAASRSAAVRAHITTRTPSAARPSAIARPIPRLAPVTSATFPAIPSSIPRAYRSRGSALGVALEEGPGLVGEVVVLVCLAKPGPEEARQLRRARPGVAHARRLLVPE